MLDISLYENNCSYLGLVAFFNFSDNLCQQLFHEKGDRKFEKGR